jgi:hypothetical protein
MHAWAAVYASATNMPQISVPAVALVIGVNEAVAVPEVHESDFTLPNSTPSESIPAARNMTFPAQSDGAVKVTTILLIVVLLRVTAVHNSPTASPVGAETANTLAHTLPSEAVLVADAVAVALLVVVGLLLVVGLLVVAGLLVAAIGLLAAATF